jgi:hypothetical protein
MFNGLASAYYHLRGFRAGCHPSRAGSLRHITDRMYVPLRSRYSSPRASSWLQTAYNTNTPPEVRLWIRRLLAIPLVPPIRLDQAFQAIVTNSPNVPGRDLMNEYVRNTYMDPNRALYNRSIWNCFGTHDRTNNVCEGHHSVLNTHFRGRHPDPYAFVQFIHAAAGFRVGTSYTTTGNRNSSAQEKGKVCCR